MKVKKIEKISKNNAKTARAITYVNSSLRRAFCAFLRKIFNLLSMNNLRAKSRFSNRV
jgi:hypothetical protein